MRYALLIYNAEPTERPPEDVMRAELDGYNAFTRHIRERGAYQAGEALDTTSTATTVRVVDGKTLATDGPFAETKEQLLGFYIIECATLDEALDIARDLGRANPGEIGRASCRERVYVLV